MSSPSLPFCPPFLRPDPAQLLAALQAIQHVAKDKQLLVDLFVNYDCSLQVPHCTPCVPHCHPTCTTLHPTCTTLYSSCTTLPLHVYRTAPHMYLTAQQVYHVTDLTLFLFFKCIV